MEDRKGVYHSILLSVRKEKMEYYKPIVEAIAERHCDLIMKAIDLGIISANAHQSGNQKASEFESPLVVLPQALVRSGSLTSKFHFLKTFKAKFCSSDEANVDDEISDAFRTTEGAQYIKEYLCMASRDDITYINQLVLQNVFSLSCHMFGNIVVQTVIENCLRIERSDIYFKLLIQLKVICVNRYGSRVVQSLIPHLEFYQLVMINEIIINNIVVFCTQLSSSNIVRRLVEKFASSCPNALLEMICSIEHSLSKIIEDAHGVSVILKILSYVPDEAKSNLSESLLTKIETNSDLLFSSKAYQVVLELYENGNSLHKKRVFQVCKAKLEEMVVGQWSSIIIHHIIDIGPKEFVEEIFHTLVSPNVLEKLLADEIGVETIEKLVDGLCMADLVQLFSTINSIKGVTHNETQLKIQEKIMEQSRAQTVLDVASGYLSSMDAFCDTFTKLEVNKGKLTGWMFALFKGEPIQLEFVEVPQFVLSLELIASKLNLGSHGVGMLRIHLVQLIKTMIAKN